MKKIIFPIVLLFSLFAHSVDLSPAELRLIDFFGEYRADDFMNIELDIQTTSLKEITQQLNAIKRPEGKIINPYALVIGYGKKALINEFIANTVFLNSEETVPELLGNIMPEKCEDARWYFYFIPKEYSSLLYEKKLQHWASPFNTIIKLGMSTKDIDGKLARWFWSF